MTDPAAGLMAIVLIVRSREGPRFVYHYPPHPITKAPRPPTRFGTELDEEPMMEESYDFEDGGDDSDLEEDYNTIHQTFGKLSMKTKHPDTDPSHDNHYDSPQGEHIVPWERLGEYPTTDLESILTPLRAYHKRRYELSLDALDFITYPIHIREDGQWRKKKAKKPRKAQKDGTASGDENPNEDSKATEDTRKQANSEDGDDHGGMTMFNVVLVLNTRRDDKDQRIQDMYDNVIKKFNKALKHAQASSDYVWKESERILAMKEKAREERKSYTCAQNFHFF